MFSSIDASQTQVPGGSEDKCHVKQIDDQRLVYDIVVVCGKIIDVCDGRLYQKLQCPHCEAEGRLLRNDGY
jgi:hypothetical protein